MGAVWPGKPAPSQVMSALAGLADDDVCARDEPTPPKLTMALPGGGETHQRPAGTLRVQVQLAAQPPTASGCERLLPARLAP
jgi:hypothetical protein